MSLTSIVTVSVVLYENNVEEISKLISSFSKCSIKIIYFIDNSPSDYLKCITNKDARIKYVHNKSNVGFGVAHNMAIKESMLLGADFHFIVNPDIYFVEDVLSPMVYFMSNNGDVGMMMPKILNDDGSIQYMPKLLPNPLSIIMRKFKWPYFYYKKFINKYELRFKRDSIFNTPVLSGCFTLLRISAIKEVGLYDDSFFMYFEDWDLSRRMHKKYKTIYFPEVSVYHGYDSGASKSRTLFKIFVKSAITYFNKWGWFFDKERRVINKKVVSQFK